MAAASPKSTQLPPGNQMPGGWARGDRGAGTGAVAGQGLVGADPVPVGDATGGTTPSCGAAGTDGDGLGAGAVVAGVVGISLGGGAVGIVGALSVKLMWGCS